jgi:four helix bundle protein
MLKQNSMEEYDVTTFNQRMRARTEKLAVSVYLLLKRIKLNDLNRIVIKQLMRSATSVAANYCSATRGRSEAEFFSKICIVVEECDETVFWLGYSISTEILTKDQAEDLKVDAEELLRIFSSIKKKLKNKRDSTT